MRRDVQRVTWGEGGGKSARVTEGGKCMANQLEGGCITHIVQRTRVRVWCPRPPRDGPEPHGEAGTLGRCSAGVTQAGGGVRSEGGSEGVGARVSEGGGGYGGGLFNLTAIRAELLGNTALDLSRGEVGEETRGEDISCWAQASELVYKHEGGWPVHARRGHASSPAG